MIHFTQFQTFPKILKKGQKFQSRDKIPKSESTGCDATALVMIKPRKHQRSIVAFWCHTCNKRTLCYCAIQSTVFGKV